MKEGNQNDRFLIFGFLRKILSKEEKENFQDRLKDDDFQDKISEETINQYGRIQLKSKLDNIHIEVEEGRRKKKIFIGFFIAALIVFLSAICWFFVLNDDDLPKLEPDQIFASYFEPYPSLFEQKGNVSSEEQGIILAMKAYTDQDFSRAVRIFKMHLSASNSENSLASFYYGIALLADNQKEKARDVLLELKQSSSANNLLPQEPLQWYLALAYLKNNNVNQARPLLEWVATQKKKSFKQKEAGEIIKKLKN